MLIGDGEMRFKGSGASDEAEKRRVFGVLCLRGNALQKTGRNTSIGALQYMYMTPEVGIPSATALGLYS